MVRKAGRQLCSDRHRHHKIKRVLELQVVQW